MEYNPNNYIIYMLVECSNSIGLGHITRSVSFYEAFIDYGYSPLLLIDGSKECIPMIKCYNYKFYPWKSEDCDLDIIKGKNVYMDAITPNQKLSDRIRDKVSKFIIIDDFCRRKYYNSLIIDWTPGVIHSGKHKKNSSDNILLLDYKYSVVRKAFISKDIESSQKRNIPVVTVIMGGSDLRNLSKTIVDSILNLGIHINLILGPSSCCKSNFTSSWISTYRALDADELKKIFINSDIVISAGGQTLFELMALGIPTIAIQVVDNQSEDIDGMKRLGFLKYVIQWNDQLLTQKINIAINAYLSMPDQDRVSKEFKKTQNFIGRGMPLIINRITEYINDNN